MPQESPGRSDFAAVLGFTSVAFFLVLLPFELIPEIPVDIDAKPFFVPLAICALLPSGRIGLAVALGVALGEGLRDLMEGYELDDPIGFFGYIAAFYAASLIFATAPFNAFTLILGSLVCAAIQSTLEASSFLLFGGEALTVAVWSAVGNTISHGLIFGAIPLLVLTPRLHGRFEAYLGFAPRGAPAPGPLKAGESDLQPGPDAIAWLKAAAYRGPGQVTPAFQRVSIAVERGEILGLTGEDPAAIRALALVLAGLAPRATGGERAGEWLTPQSVTLITAPARDCVTQARPIQEVAAALRAADRATPAPFDQAAVLLAEAGLAEDRHEAFIWALDPEEQMRVLVAAARARRAELLIIDGALEAMDDAEDVFSALFDEQRGWGAVILLDPAPGRLAAWSDRLMELGPEGLVSVSRPEVAVRQASSQDDAAVLSDPVEDASPAFVPTLQTHPGGWWWRRDPRAKWLVLIVLITLIYVAPDWRWMAAMCGLGLIMALTARPSPFWLGFALLVQAPNVLGLILLPIMTGEADGLADLEFGLRLGLGWIAAIVFGLSLLSSMDAPDIVTGLRGLGLPRRFAFTVGYAFLFIYLSFADFSQVFARARRDRRPVKPWRPDRAIGLVLALVVPAIVMVARRGGKLRLALDAAGPGAEDPPVRRTSLRIADYALVAASLTALIGAVTARVAGLA